jgi:hypothetical protein
MEQLNQQMKRFSAILRDDLKIEHNDSNNLATAIIRDVSQIQADDRNRILASQIFDIRYRIDELVAFQQWMDLSKEFENNPAVARARVITQNYLCFVYLGEALFNNIKRSLPSCTAKKCCSYLTNNPVRAFRNALAHANWKYVDDFSAIEFWAKKGNDPNEKMVYWIVNNAELNFWQALSRCTAYAIYLTLSQ